MPSRPPEPLGHGCAMPSPAAGDARRTSAQERLTTWTLIPSWELMMRALIILVIVLTLEIAVTGCCSTPPLELPPRPPRPPVPTIGAAIAVELEGGEPGRALPVSRWRRLLAYLIELQAYADALEELWPHPISDLP